MFFLIISQPDNSAGIEHCSLTWEKLSDTSGMYVNLNDANCASSYAAVCEIRMD